MIAGPQQRWRSSLSFLSSERTCHFPSNHVQRTCALTVFSFCIISQDSGMSSCMSTVSDVKKNSPFRLSPDNSDLKLVVSSQTRAFRLVPVMVWCHFQYKSLIWAKILNQHRLSALKLDHLKVKIMACPFSRAANA